MSSTDKWPHLFQFLGGYFHQDWSMDDLDASSVVDRFVADAGPDTVRVVRQEIEQILGRGLGENQLRELVIEELGCGYDPTSDGLTIRGWLQEIKARLK